MLRREGEKVNRKRVDRGYRYEGLQIRMRLRRRKHMSLQRGPASQAQHTHERWSIDFVHDQLFGGRDVVAGLDRAIERADTPGSTTIDHGTEFTSKMLEEWAYRRGVKLDFVHPGNPLKPST
jgi:putative transposase